MNIRPVVSTIQLASFESRRLQRVAWSGCRRSMRCRTVRRSRCETGPTRAEVAFKCSALWDFASVLFDFD